MATRKSKRRYIAGDVEDAIRQAARLGRTPSQIEEELSRDERLAGRLPTLRTIQRYASDEVPSAAGVWTMKDSVDGSAVIAALREVVLASNGERLFITPDEASGVERVARIAPDIPPLAWFMLATSRLERDVQLFLAFHPWRNEHDRSMYLRIILPAGLRVPIVPPRPTLITQTPTDFWASVARTHDMANAVGSVWTRGKHESQS